MVIKHFCSIILICYIIPYAKSTNTQSTDSIDLNIIGKEANVHNLKPGEYGKPVILSGLTSQEEALREDLYKKYGYNQLASEKISTHRSLPDFRNEYCKVPGKFNPTNSTSIIITFYNEAVTTFLRTIHSILERSPPHLIQEIILVDDYSEFEDLKESFDKRLEGYEKIKIIRAPQRLGLIKARLLGLQYATAPIITFLDAHVECTKGWLEPLIARIEENPTVVATPVIDWINADTLSYNVTFSTSPDVGGFTWDLYFDWIEITKERFESLPHRAAPMPSPTNVGGIFSISRQFFERLGYYDDQFEIWGAENLELSFKAWMCGGSIEYISCSRVGHIYKVRSTYRAKLQDRFLIRNLIRLAEVWMDDYKQYFYSMISNQLVDFGDVSARHKLRQNLKCHSFEWYMDNVVPEMFNPKRNALKGGEIRNLGDLTICLDISRSNKANAHECQQEATQHIWYTKQFELRNEYKCLDYDGQNIFAYKCHGLLGNQQFVYDEKTKQIVHISTSKCLTMEKNVGQKTNQYNLKMDQCNENIIYQKWNYKSFIKSLDEN